MSYEIRPATHDSFGPKRVQFVECDPDIQAARGTPIGRNELERKLKALCLLNDVVAIGATHVLKSKDTFSVLQKNPQLISEGPVVFTMSRSHDSFTDMLDRKLSNPERHNPLWTSKKTNIAKDEQKLYQRAKFLERHATSVMTRDISNMRDSFSSGLAFELSEEESPLRKQILQSGVNPTSLREKIEETDQSSRKFVHGHADSLPKPVYRKLKQHADINYHLTGSTFHNAATTLHPYEIAEAGVLYRRLVNVYGNQDELTATMSNPIHSNCGNSEIRLLGPKVPQVNDALALRMFSDITGGLKQGVGDLTGEEVLELRNKRVTENLREKLSLLTNNIHRDTVTVSDLNELENTRREFENALRAEYQNEQDKQEWAQQVTNQPTVLAASIGMNFLGSYLLSSDESFAAGSSLSATLWLIGRYFPAFIDTDLIDFEKEYEDILEN